MGGRLVMGFGDAIRSVFRQYASFTGRARRSEYWWFTLFAILVYLVAVLVDLAVNAPIFLILVALALLLPGLAVSVLRLHDSNRPGGWIFISLVPFVGSIILLIFQCQDSTPGPNTYGPSPKYATAVGPYGA